ncbi:MAG TPA: creatininase family protein [Tepidisphaeraceae bacterium]|nr:creatininase family protein [Tepidisphaeraceae bacterium]
MFYSDQSWPAIQAMDKNKPVVIPLGALEQHGHHLPTATDMLQVQAIARGAEAQLSNEILLMPTLWLGSSDHHIDFPGLLSVSGELYSHMIRSIASSLLRAGFKKQLFLNGHGGNAVPIQQALGDFCNEDEQADEAYLMFANWWSICRDAIAPAKLDIKQPGVNHACEYETSLMLHLHPQWVNMSETKDRPPVLDSAWTKSGKVTWFGRFARRTAGGATGYSTRATTEKGKIIFESAVSDLVAFLKEFVDWPPLPLIGPK